MGTTTFALALTNYLCNKLRCKSAYLELNATDEISNLCKDSYRDYFLYCGITIYPNVTFTALSEISSPSYEYLVLDMGIIHPNIYSEYFRNDLCILLGSICPWKSREYYMFLEELKKYNKKYWDKVWCFGSFGIKEHTRLFQKHYHYHLETYPYLENPFRLTSGDWHFYERLIKGIS